MNANDILEIVLSYDGVTEVRSTEPLDKLYSITRELNGKIALIYAERKQIVNIMFHDREWLSPLNFTQEERVLISRIQKKYEDKFTKASVYIVLVDQL